MRQIQPHSLWIGHAGDVRRPADVHAAGILALVDLALTERPLSLARETVYFRLPLVDGAGNPPWLLRAAVDTVASLVRSGVPTLVFCGAGMSRSPRKAAAALAAVTGETLDASLAAVVRDGPRDVSPALWADVVRALTPA